MLCQLRLLLVCFLKVLTVTTVFSSDVIAKMESNWKTRSEKFKNDKFCESKNSWMTRNVMKATTISSLECRSKEQIRWILSNPNEFEYRLGTKISLDYHIESQWKKCGSNVINMTDDYYFTSTLNLNRSVYEDDKWPISIFPWEIVISCAHYRSSTNESETLPTTSLIRSDFFRQTGNIEYKPIKSKWTPPCDDVILDIYKPNKTCSCRRVQNSFFKPQFLSCDNLVECEHLAHRKYAYFVTPCSGTLFNYCNSTSFDVELQGSGFIFCTIATGGIVPYVPYMSLGYGSDLKGIRILTNDFSTYSQFLIISSLSGHSTFSTKDQIELQCSGPKFIFLKDFRWSLQSGNATFDSFLEMHLTLTATAFGENDLIVSILTLTASEHINDINMSIICEAAVANTNETVQSEPFSFKLLVPQPKVNDSIVCLNNKIVLYKCNIDDEPGIHLTWHSNKSNLVLEGCSVKPEFKDACLLDDKCPDHSIICTAFRDGVETSKYFTRTNCQDFVRNNCTSNNKVIYTSIENAQNATETGGVDQVDYGIPIGVGFGLCLLIFVPLMVFCWKKSKERWKRETIESLTEQDILEFLEGKPTIDRKEIHASIYALPLHQQFMISRQDLEFDLKDLLGKGHYGMVMKGQVRRNMTDSSNEESVTVAVKTVKPFAGSIHLKALLSEIKIMAHLESHLNIVKFIGACSENIRNGEIFAVVEFCSKGDLHRLLRKSRNGFQNFFEQRSTSDLKHQSQDESNLVISTNTLLNWALDIANGMAYLSHKKVIHGDLATRNVLIGENNVAKVSDFGLSRELLNCYEQYIKKQRTALPFRWMALECLKDMTFSVQSDVWSFGVTLWEIFSLGEIPYPNFSWDNNFMNKINSGYRLQKPEYANDQIYNLMLACWNLNPLECPRFSELFRQFQEIISQLQIKHQPNVNYILNV